MNLVSCLLFLKFHSNYSYEPIRWLDQSALALVCGGADDRPYGSRTVAVGEQKLWYFLLPETYLRCVRTSRHSFFSYNWKKETWNLLFVLGVGIGGFIAANFLANPSAIVISEATQADLTALGVSDFTALMPLDIFSWENVFNAKGLLFFVVGGFLVGFGTRYAGGCTSGHAIMGISNLQWPSLVATVFFMLGGFLMTNVLLEPLMKWVGF